LSDWTAISRGEQKVPAGDRDPISGDDIIANIENLLQLRDGAPHFEHISGWGVVVVLLSYCLSRPHHWRMALIIRRGG